MPATKVIYTIILLLIAHVAIGQMVFSGHVNDVATQSDVPGVKIEWKKTQKTAFSNYFGDFTIKRDKINTASKNEYSIFSNALIWEGSDNFELKIINLNGQELFHQSLSGGNGSYSLPRLKNGIYVLLIKTERRIETYKLLSDGFETIAVDKNTPYFSGESSDQNDTLIFSKEGYYSREVIVPGKSTHLHIGMLKGSYQNLNYFNELIDPLAFDVISSVPSRSNAGEVKSVKIIYDTEKDMLYYMNTKRYELHYTFATEVLGFKQGIFVFNQTQYKNNLKRYMNLGSINYYQSQDRFVLQFVPLTEMNCEEIKILYDKILSTSFMGEKLFFYSIKSEWDNCNGIKEVSSEDLFNGQNYQALNLTHGYGYLRKISLVDLPQEYLSRQDIVLLDGIPNDLSVVAGMITTAYQTPLSHINVLSNSRGTPNMALIDGWSNPQLDTLIDELIYLNVTAETYEIRRSTLEEATAFWESNTPQDPVFLEKDILYSELVDMQNADISFLNRIGGKAANFSEIMNVSFKGETIPVPEGAFSIPFYYYQKHLEENGLDDFISSMLKDEVFNSDPNYRKKVLQSLKDQITNAPIDMKLVDQVNLKINKFQQFEAYRFRSSTNAEDLEVFSGAGLYDSYSAKKDQPTKTVERAIKRVWASLWNWRAFEERSYFMIDHESCAMGILVHRSFPDEDANGVMVTKNLYNFNHGFVVNVQFGENSIVFPEPGIIHDQIILYDYPVDQNNPFLIEYLTFSNLPEALGGRIMTDAELIELGNYCMKLKEYFYYNLQHQCNCSFTDFGLDIEFKVDSQLSRRKVYIKQARLYR